MENATAIDNAHVGGSERDHGKLLLLPGLTKATSVLTRNVLRIDHVQQPKLPSLVHGGG